MAIKYSNNAKTTLAAAINSTVTTITVVDASTLPTLAVGDEMYLTLSEPFGSATEIIKCTSISGTTLTVVRGYESTAALSWIIDSKVELRVTAGLLSNLLDSKIDDSQVLTDVPANAVFTDSDTVYTHPTTPGNFHLPANGTVGQLLVNTASGTATWQDVSVNGVENSVQFIATAGQTTFTTSYYTGYVDVYLNGILLATTDYTATDGANVILDVGAAVSDVVYIQAFGVFELADHYNKVDADARYAQTVNHYTKAAADSLLAGKVDDSQVLTNVPSGALFTDTNTVYTHPTNHAISVITGLQSALNDKVDDSQVLTNVPSNAVFTDTNTVYTHPSNHPISVITGLQTALNNKVDDTQVLTNVPSGAVFTDTNTTYSVGDGGLTTNDFTDADHNKLNGIAAGANNYTLPSGLATETYVGTQISNLVDSSPATLNTLNELAAALGDDPNFATTVATSIAGKVDDSQVLTNVPAGALFTDTNTTYTVGDGGLSQINFTSADHTKLNDIATSANNYSFPHTISYSPSNSTVVLRHSSGYIYANYFNGSGTFSTSGSSSGMGLFTGTNGSDTFGRSYTAAAARTLLNVENGATADQSATQIKAHLVNGIDSTHYVDGSIDRVHLAADIIDGTKIANDVINSEHYVAGSIDNEHIADNAINSEHYADNSIDALHLNVSGNGTTSQYLRSDGDGTMSWVTPPDTNTDTNTTYSADGNYGMTLSGTAFRLEDDRRRNSTTTDVYSGNTHDYTFYDASHGIRWYTAGAEEMRLEDDGDLHVDGSVTAYSATVSDERLKTDIVTLENAVDKIKQIRGVEFTRIKDGKRSAGVIAQELEVVLPQAITEKALPFEADTETLYKTVDYDQIHGLLIEAIKEQQVQIDELKALIK